MNCEKHNLHDGFYWVKLKENKAKWTVVLVDMRYNCVNIPGDNFPFDLNTFDFNDCEWGAEITPPIDSL